MMGVAARSFIFFTALTGIAYPLLMTGIGQVFFHDQANGSILLREGKPIGSVWIGQKFENSGHFWGRPSAIEYNPVSSGATNLGPTSQDLRSKVEERRKLGLVGELLFASGSGLDPHMSVESAKHQADRVAKTRGLTTQAVVSLIEENIEFRQFGIFGEPRVNVLKLNLAIEGMK